MKKVIILGVVLFITIAAFTACNTAEPVTLESMQVALAGAGYEGIEQIDSLPENAVGGFTFIFSGAHGNVHIPVVEFKDNASAEAYANYVNTGEGHLAIVNDKFLTTVEAHHGIAHADEKTFLENLISGKSVK
jgi:hypothetical protein